MPETPCVPPSSCRSCRGRCRPPLCRTLGRPATIGSHLPEHVARRFVCSRGGGSGVRRSAQRSSRSSLLNLAVSALLTLVYHAARCPIPPARCVARAQTPARPSQTLFIIVRVGPDRDGVPPIGMMRPVFSTLESCLAAGELSRGARSSPSSFLALPIDDLTKDGVLEGDIGFASVVLLVEHVDRLTEVLRRPADTGTHPC